MSSSPPRKRKAYPSVAQKARLIGLLEADPELRGGKFSATFSVKESVDRWTQITNILNSIPGAKKTWKEWRKTWQDMKAKVKKKDVEVRRSANLTGGGSPLPPLSTEDEQVLHTISESARVGHSDSQESIVIFDDVEHSLEVGEVAITEGEEGISSHTYPAPSEIIEIDVEPPSASDHAPSTSRLHRPQKKNRLQKSIDVAETLSKVLKERNTITEKYYKECLAEKRKQSNAMMMQAEALAKQADALTQIARCQAARSNNI